MTGAVLHRISARQLLQKLPAASLRNQNLRSATTQGNAASDSPRAYEEMPGPKALPLVGNIWRFLPVIGPWNKLDLNQLLIHLHEKYGKFVRLSGMPENRDMVFIYDANEIEKMFRNEGPWPKRNAFESLDYYRRVMHKKKFEGANGLLTTNGDEWHEFRRRVQGPLLQPRAIAKYTEPVDVVAAKFLQRLDQMRDKNGVLPDNTISWFFRWALESVAVVVLDAHLGCLAAEVGAEPQRLIDAVLVIFDASYDLDVRPSLWRLVSTPTWRRYVKALDTLEEICEKYIQQAVERMKAKVAEKGELGDELSILERLLLANENPRIAITMATDMIFGGIETTSYSIAILLYYLSKNPDKQELLHQELRTYLPNADSPVTVENLQEMKYLKASVKESMRMKPVVNGAIRENPKEGLVLGNYYIPKGVDVVMATNVTGNSAEYFSEPERFLPERWLKGEGHHGKRHAFAVLPFGFGARTCVGKRFAELEIEVVTAKIIRKYRVEYPREATFENRFVHMMTSPLNFRLTYRE